MSRGKTFVPLLDELEGALARATSKHVQAAVLLLFYCNRQRNGGRIPRALVDDGMELGILILAGLRGVLEEPSGLWHWEDDTLVLDVYSVEHERSAEAGLEQRRAAIASRWKKEEEKRARKSSKNSRNTSRNTGRISSRNTSRNTDRQIESLSKDREILSLNHAPDCESDSSVSAIETEPPCPPGGVSVEVLSAEEVHAGFEAIRKELE